MTAVLQHLPSVPQPGANIRDVAKPRIRGRALEERDDDLRQIREVLFEPNERLGIACREPSRLVDVLLHVVAQQVARAVGVEVQGGTGRIDDDTARLQSHVAPHRLAQHR